MSSTTEARVNKREGRDEFLGLSMRAIAALSTIIAGIAVAYAALKP